MFPTISSFEKKYSRGAKAARDFKLVKEIWPNVGEGKKRPVNLNSARQMRLKINKINLAS